MNKINKIPCGVHILQPFEPLSKAKFTVLFYVSTIIIKTFALINRNKRDRNIEELVMLY
jgi:hypothetical protein